MEKSKISLTPLPYMAADETIRKIYRRFFELRQTKTVNGRRKQHEPSKRKHQF